MKNERQIHVIQDFETARLADRQSAATLALHHNAELITLDSAFSAIAHASNLRVQVLARP